MNLFDLLNEEANVEQEQNVIMEAPKKENEIVAAKQEEKVVTEEINEEVVISKEENNNKNSEVSEDVTTSEETSIEDSLTLNTTTDKKSETKVAKNTKKDSEKAKSTLKGDAKIQEDCKKCTSITVKYFGNEIFTIDDEEEIANISLKDIHHSLVHEYNYQEFASGVTWYLANGTDKKQGYLVATLKNFGNKG